MIRSIDLQGMLGACSSYACVLRVSNRNSMWTYCLHVGKMDYRYFVSDWQGVRSPGGGYLDLVWMGVYHSSLKTLPIFKDDFGRKWYPFWGIFLYSPISHNFWVFTMQIPKNFGNLGKWDPCLGIFLWNMWPMFRDFLWKSNPLEWHIPVYLNMRVSPCPVCSQVSLMPHGYLKGCLSISSAKNGSVI